MSSNIYVFQSCQMQEPYVVPCITCTVRVINPALPSTVFCAHPHSEVPSNLVLKSDNSYILS